MAKKTTLTDNQILILFHAGRGDLADVCDLSVDANGRYGQDVAYLQAKGFLTPRSDTVPKTTDMGEIVIARLVAAKH